MKPLLILRVAVPSPLRRYFDYLAPVGIDPQKLQAGIRLQVPFGRSKRIGILAELRNHTPLPQSALKPALQAIDTEPVIPSDIMQLALWAQQYYQHPPGEVFATLLPALLRQGHNLTLKQAPYWRITAAGQQALAEHACKRAPRQQVLLQLLAEYSEGLSAEHIRKQLVNWSATAKALAAKNWIETLTEAPQNTVTSKAPELNLEQQDAVSTLDNLLGKFHPVLLEGVTGSGKTEVYLQIITALLDRQQQALVLVPEIGLTPQLVARFQRRLSVPLAVLHSGLNNQERLNAWLQARSGHARVVLGTRSAIFAPLPDLGLIIIDEEHDPSFKQQDGFRYNARDLAIVRARNREIPVILGSATPALESLHNARQNRYQHLSLPQRVGAASVPTFELLDIRHQPLQEGLSTPLLEQVERHLQAQGQVILFLNRRGFAPTLMCHECGWTGSCAQCDAHLTVHLKKQKLLCHHCGAEQKVPRACPACGSVDMRPLGIGTERLEKILKQRFPDIQLARIDRDSTRRKGSLQALLDDIKQGKRQLLIGTQMLAKGHHFPNVTLVGIIDTDQGLFSADFRASERLAQLILQVAGRAGRAERPGSVIIQTHHPNHPLLNTLITQGYPEFARAALIERQQALLPPYSYHALLRAEAAQPERGLQFLQQALQAGQSYAYGVELLGPIPAPMERRAGRYRAQLLIQATVRAPLHKFLSRWLDDIEALPERRKVRWSLDVDPYDMF